jgi:hypothetical protein
MGPEGQEGFRRRMNKVRKEVGYWEPTRFWIQMTYMVHPPPGHLTKFKVLYWGVHTDRWGLLPGRVYGIHFNLLALFNGLDILMLVFFLHLFPFG